MSRIAKCALCLVLAVGLLYGRFFLPGQMQHDPRDEELQSLRDEVDSLQVQSASLERENRQLTERLLKVQIAWDSTRCRDEYQELLRRYRSGSSKEANQQGPKRMPPPEEMLGHIKAVDDTSGRVTVNLGSDVGLNRGNTLEVYRLTPARTYLGLVRILEVRPNEAVGKLIVRFGAVQAGDEAASDILGLIE